MAEIDPQTKRRAAELLALGCSHPEVAKAKGVHARTIAKWLREPAFREEVEKAKEAKGGGLVQDALDVLRASVDAKTHDGEPAYLVRGKAVDSILKNADIIDKMEGRSEDDEELRGTIRVYPGQGLLCPHCGKPLEDSPADEE